jgi:hypothetical protein
MGIFTENISVSMTGTGGMFRMIRRAAAVIESLG